MKLSKEVSDALHAILQAGKDPLQTVYDLNAFVGESEVKEEVKPVKKLEAVHFPSYSGKKK